jgi:uncharacterized protein YjiS (DUF1127 family)
MMTILTDRVPHRELWTRTLHQRVASAAARFGRWLEDAAERRRQRRALEELDDRALHDIGLTRGDVYCETNKPFWRP